MTMKQHAWRATKISSTKQRAIKTSEYNGTQEVIKSSLFLRNACADFPVIVVVQYKRSNITFMLICSRKRGTSSQAKR